MSRPLDLVAIHAIQQMQHTVAMIESGAWIVRRWKANREIAELVGQEEFTQMAATGRRTFTYEINVPAERLPEGTPIRRIVDAEPSDKPAIGAQAALDMVLAELQRRLPEMKAAEEQAYENWRDSAKGYKRYNREAYDQAHYTAGRLQNVINYLAEMARGDWQ